nr:ParA family protein [Microbacterium endophyticum]
MTSERSADSVARVKVIGVYSVKGGVGKSTTAVNLAWEAAKDHRVLLWDLDPQAAATYLLAVKPKLKGGAESLVGGKGKPKTARAVRKTAFERLDVLPGDDSYRDLEVALDAAKHSTRRIEKVLGPLANDYDVVILDCPPGSSLLAQAVIRASDLVVLPVVPSPLSARSLQQVRDVVSAEPKPPKILGFLSMADRRKTAHRNAIVDFPANEPDMSDIVIPATVVVERMGSERSPLGVVAPGSVAAQESSRLWRAAWDAVAPRRRKGKK